VGDDEYGQANYGNILSTVPGDLNNDGKADWIASDWGYIGNSGNSASMGAVYLTFQR